MSFPLQSPEKVSLVPVIATLLQFNAKELEQVRDIIVRLSYFILSHESD
jgi:GRIP domain